MQPFRSFLLATDECPSYATVDFDFEGGIANAIAAVETDSSDTLADDLIDQAGDRATQTADDDATVYDLAGRHVATASQQHGLRPGIYVSGRRRLAVERRR